MDAIVAQSMQNKGGEEYQRMTLHAQIRLRPDTYIGASAGVTTEAIWSATIVGDSNIKVNESFQHVSAAIIGISKEVFDNATDNVERSRAEGYDPGTIDVSMTQNSICVKNHGKHIPVVIHHKEQIWVPQMLFGVLLTSDNYDDSITRYKAGRNGYGVKLTNIFSKGFQVIVADPVNGLKFSQTWMEGMTKHEEPVIERYVGPGFTQITFIPDFEYFYEVQGQHSFLDSMMGFYLNRTMGMSFSSKIITSFNGMTLDYRDARVYFQSHFDGPDPNRKTIHWQSQDMTQEFVIAETPGAGFINGFVNGIPVHQGEHVNEYLRVIFEDMVSKFDREHGKKVTVAHLKKHVSILIRVTLDKPAFDTQIKRKLVKPKPKVVIPKKIQKDVVSWDLMEEELKKGFNMKIKATDDKRMKKTRVLKVNDATQANSGNYAERLKCTLILTEGETGKTLALMANKFLPGGMKYNGVYPLKGKVMNTSRHTDENIDANKELSDIMAILGAERDVDYTQPENFKKLRYGKIAIMTDADLDGSHIAGLIMKFVFDMLRSLAPFEFILMILTPVIEAKKGSQLMHFYQMKKFKAWEKSLTPEEMKPWKIFYKKGLGSWTPSPGVVKKLFEKPAVLTMAVDPTTDDILNLCFNTKLCDERKQWISAYDPNSESVLTNPRPITEFFQEEFRDYSKDSVLRAIPYLMDGLKRVHRKVLYCMFLKFPKGGKQKAIKVPQFGGVVTEKTNYHHGEQALYKTIIGMAQQYVTGPNNLPLILGEGNFGQRRGRGKDQSPARYLTVEMHPITYYIYRVEDQPLWEIQYEDGEPAEPKNMFPIIPMCLVNRCKGIATGWSTNIPCHDPRVVIDWVIAWINEEKTKRDIPKASLEINISDKPELVPYWRDYRGTITRIKNAPYEVYENTGHFNFHLHTIFVDELPVETSPDSYKEWGETIADLYLERPEEALFRTFDMCTEPPAIDFRITGMSNPTLKTLGLVEQISLSNMVLIDKDDRPRKFTYTYEIICQWCLDRLDIYEKRRLNIVKEIQEELRKKTLKYMFIEDVVEKRLELRNRPKAEIHEYMTAKGYPCNKKRDGDDFLTIPIGTITREKVNKLKKEIGELNAKLQYYMTVLPEDIWLSDLDELKAQVHKLYLQPLE